MVYISCNLECEDICNHLCEKKYYFDIDVTHLDFQNLY